MNRFKGKLLSTDFRYQFPGDFEELFFHAADGGVLNGVLFKADSAKGVICFWKGNGGTIQDWVQRVPFFLSLRYDVMVTDYRENGKSRGSISLENFYADAQHVYDTLKQRYPETHIVNIGFSLGGRIAAHLAAENLPKVTVLIDPASTTGDFSDRFLATLYAPLPEVIGFEFRTEADVRQSKTPVIVIGSNENANSVAKSLRPLLKEKGRYFEITGATHGTIQGHNDTQKILEALLK